MSLLQSGGGGARDDNDDADPEYEMATGQDGAPLFKQDGVVREVWINGRLIKTSDEEEDDNNNSSQKKALQTTNKKPGGKKAEIPEVPSEKAAYYYKRARRLFADGTNTSIELERVIRDVLRASQFVPNEVNHYNFMAVVYKKVQDISSAMNCLRVVVRLQPTHVVAKKQLYELLVKSGQEHMSMATAQGNDARYYASAKVSFEAALKLEKYEAKIWTFLAICCVRLSKFKEALDAVNRALNNESGSSTPASLELFIVRAKLYWAMGYMEAGNKDIRLASTKLPYHPEVLAYTTKAYIRAESFYKQSCSFFNAGNYPESLRMIQFALSVSNEDVKLHIMLSKVQRVMGDLPKAYAAIQQASNYYRMSSEFGANMALPEDIVKQTNLIFNEMAMQYASKGDYERAIVLFNKAINSEKSLGKGLIDPDYRYYVNRGDCYRATKKYDLAMMDYKNALRLNKTDWNIKTKLSLSHYLVAVDYYNQMSFVECEREISEAISLNCKVSEYYSTRGRARYFTSNYRGAYDDYQSCLELDPSNEDVIMKMKQFESEGGGGRGGGTPLVKDTKSHPVNPIVVSKEDMIAMMLTRHDKEKQQNKCKIPLPAVKLKSLVNEEYRRKPPSVPHQSPRVLLPKVNPNFSAALMVSLEAKLMDENVKKVMNEKTKTAKDHLWSMMTNAKTLARSLEKVSEVQLKMGSAVSLKRASQQRAKEGMKNAPLTGVIAKNKIPSFKLISSSSSKRSNKGSNGGDDVTIESGSNAGGEEADANEEGKRTEEELDQEALDRILRGEKELDKEKEKIAIATEVVKEKKSKKAKPKKQVRKVRRFDDQGQPLEKVEVYFDDEDVDSSDGGYDDSDDDYDVDDDRDSELLHMLAKSGVSLDFNAKDFQEKLAATDALDDSALSSLLISEEEEMAIMKEREAQRLQNLEDDKQNKIRALEAVISEALDGPDHQEEGEVGGVGEGTIIDSVGYISAANSISNSISRHDRDRDPGGDDASSVASRSSLGTAGSNS